MAPVPFIDTVKHQAEKGELGKSLLGVLLYPKFFLGLIAVLGTAIFAGELCIMFLLERFPVESALLEAIIDATMLMAIITPVLLLVYQRPLTKQGQAAAHEASGTVTGAPRSMPRLLVNTRRVLCLVILLGITVFSGEVLVMLSLIAFPVDNPLVEAVIDSLLLVIIISPALYYLYYRPVMSRVDALTASRRQIRALTQRLMQLSEDEQRRLALDLHDEFGQTLSAMKLEVDSLRSCFESTTPEAAATFDSLHQRINEMRDSVHHIARSLRPSILDDLGIAPALEGLIGEYQRVYPAIVFDLQITGLKARPPSSIETAIYRVCQEAVNNALKHGDPRRIEVRLTASYPDLIVVIQDDGCGFEPEMLDREGGSSGQHLGILGMRERTESFDGTFTLSSPPGEGGRIRAVFPSEEFAHEIDA